jgi:hypothetical protein
MSKGEQLLVKVRGLDALTVSVHGFPFLLIIHYSSLITRHFPLPGDIFRNAAPGNVVKCFWKR